ncbi:MAG TPA: response regulator transcription factor [Dongiaceae bacterium]|nr:response regulator transcription factor [Dongiaceae bacterium]
MTTVLVADDHPMFREALADALRSIIERVDVIESGSMTETIGAVADSADIDLILLDLRMPGVNGVKGVRTLRVRRPDVPVAVISALSDSFVVRECFDAGAIGYIPKSLSRAAIADAISTILDGGSYAPHEGIAEAKPDIEAEELDDAVRCRFELLTNQQRKVLELMAAGLLNKQIAHEIDVQITTVKAHVSSLLQKLGVSSRTQAVILYQKYNKSASLPNRRDQRA